MAATEAHQLSDARYKSGRDSYFLLLDATRTLYAAEQALVTTRLQEQANPRDLVQSAGRGLEGARMSGERMVTEKAAARADAQRERILAAAQQCFIAEGFHAATIAAIAERAGMSAGLIYRYFDSKRAIVLAIIERELHQRRAHIAAQTGNVDFVGGLVETFRELRGDSPLASSAVLFLEMTAEGTRVPEVAHALQAADQAARLEFAGWLQRKVAHGCAARRGGIDSGADPLRRLGGAGSAGTGARSRGASACHHIRRGRRHERAVRASPGKLPKKNSVRDSAYGVCSWPIADGVGRTAEADGARRIAVVGAWSIRRSC
jgi:AcrR family transcriptional regulator